MPAALIKKYLGFSAVCVCVLLTPCGQTAPTPAPKKGAAKAVADTSAAPVEPHIPLSVFVVPKDPTQGKDPFFPASLHPYGPGKQTSPNRAPVVEVTLTLNGFI